MHRIGIAVFSTAIVLTVVWYSPAKGAGTADQVGVSKSVELARSGIQYSAGRLEPARMGAEFGIAVIFEGTEDLHYYATAKSAPAQGYELKVSAESDVFEFGLAAFPKWTVIKDPLGEQIEVYAGRFYVFVPIASVKPSATSEQLKAGNLTVRITGIACTSIVCLQPFERALAAKIDWSSHNSWKEISLAPDEQRSVQAPQRPALSTWFALLLALAAGVTLNIMPCVLPVIPLKVLSIFEQAKQSKARCIALGLSFCLGILLFFGGIAVLNIVLRLGYGTAFQWGDHFRRPFIVIGMSLLMVVLSLLLFGIVTVVVPSSVAGKSGPRKGHGGSLATGFLAAILSTPCSFAILTAAFAWAQTQRLPLATLTIMLIGVGMAAPYAILTSTPALLKYLPKPGRWMELFKQTMGFILLAVAVWLVLSLPADRQTGVLYYAIILAFCVWMWGGWVNLLTPKTRRRAVRTVALVIALAAGVWLLPEPTPSSIDWQPYDKVTVDKAIDANRPVLIEFTANWCLNCKVVEKFTYTRRDIADLIKRKAVLPVRADTTLDSSQATLDQKEVYKEPAVPVTLLFIPGKTEPERLRGWLITGDLRRLLRSLPDKHDDPNQQGAL